MFIRELCLQNILSFGQTDSIIPLGPLNVFIGPNGAGKSNILEAISLLKASPSDMKISC